MSAAAGVIGGREAPAEGVTVALVPDGRYDRLRDLALRWVDAWLIDPLLLVRTGGTAMSVASGGGVPVVSAERLDRGIQREVPDLVAHLADRDPAPDVLRVVDVVLGAADGDVTDDAWTALRSEAEAIAELLRSASGRRTVRRIALVAIDTGRRAVAGRLDDVPQPRWDVNVLAAPENRRTPGGFDAFVRRDASEYDGFVLAHLATVGGLWSGVRSGSYDRAPHGAEGHLDLQRVTVRAVQHGVRHLRGAAAVASRLVGDPGPVVPGPVGREAVTLVAGDGAELGLLEPARQVRVLDEYARQVLDEVPERPLRVRIDAAVRTLGPEERGFVAAVRMLVRDTIGLVRRVAALPRRLRGWARAGRARGAAPSGGIDAGAAADGGAALRLADLDAALARSYLLDPPGTRFFVWGHALWGAGSRRHAAGVWRQAHDPAVALLDGRDPSTVWGPIAWMRAQRFEGILPGPGSIVPDHLETWRMPAPVGRLLGLADDGAAVRVGAADRIAIRHRWATLQRLVGPAEAVLAAAEGRDGEGDDGDGEPLDPRPEPDADAVGSESGPDPMSLEEARAVLAADAELREWLERLDATGLGRVQRATADEFSALCDALQLVRDRLADALAGRRERSKWDAVLRGALFPIVTLPVAVALPASAPGVGLLLMLAAVAAGSAFAIGTIRTGERLDAVARAQALVDLSDIAERTLAEWARVEHMAWDLHDVVALVSHLLHHGASPAGVDAPSVPLLARDDVPRLVSLAVPIDRDAAGELDPSRRRRCLEKQHVAGWRAKHHRELLEGLTAAAPGLFGGLGVVEALDAEPRRAADLLERLADARGEHEREAFRRLVRRGVEVLEGADVEPDAPSELTGSGTTGSPAALVRVLDAAAPSSDSRTDGLAPSLPAHPIWDAFLLAGALPDDEDVRDPWAGHVFAMSREAERAHGAQRTEVHLPVRLVAGARRRLGDAGGDVDLTPLRDDQVRFVELVVRVDTQPDGVSMSALSAAARDWSASDASGWEGSRG